MFLGDLVGYGADSFACLDLLAGHAAKGALLVRCNHDEAAAGRFVRGQELRRPCEGRMAVLYPVAPGGGGEPGLLKLPKLEFRNYPAGFASLDVEVDHCWA